MARSCSTGLHSPSTDVVRNQGFDFTQCRHCRRDLIRSKRRWRTVPGGFRVAWRAAEPPRGEDPAQLKLDLSPAGRSVIVWRAEERSIWRPGALLGLAMLGFFYLVWTAADRLCDSFSRVAARRLRSKVLKLPAA
jgi:hypothetical protein